MANRYWVGGTGTWNTTSTTNWSASSGGASGASVPTAADSVFFDQAATYTVTCTGALTCLDITVSAGLVTFAVGTTPTLAISGSMTFAAGKLVSWPNIQCTFNATTTGKTVTTNNQSFAGIMRFDGVGGGWSLGSACTTSNSFLLVNGSFTTGASNTFTFGTFNGSNSNTRSLTLSSSIIFSTNGVWNLGTTTNLTFSGTGSYIYMNGSGTRQFIGGGLSYGYVDNNGSTALTVSGSNTFLNFVNSYNATGPATITFTSGTTQTFTNFTATGTASGPLTINSTVAGSAATLSKASGTVSVDYVSIQDSTATGGATWNAGVNSTNVSGNTGWNFASAARNSNFFFFM